MAGAIANLFRLWKIARPWPARCAVPARISGGHARAAAAAARCSAAVAQKHEAGTPGERLARALESLGPAHIKLGQVLATRPDIVGAEVATALEGLQDRLPPFPDARRARRSRRRSAVRWKRLFSGFGEPVAAASIAQVHEARPATCRRSACGQSAASRYRGGFARDLSALAFAARLAERFSPEARRLRVDGADRDACRIDGAGTRSAHGSGGGVRTWPSARTTIRTSAFPPSIGARTAGAC